MKDGNGLCLDRVKMRMRMDGQRKSRPLQGQSWKEKNRIINRQTKEEEQARERYVVVCGG